MRVSDGPQSGGGVSLFRSVSWNYLGYFCELIAGVLLLAYVVRRVPVEDYGLFLLAQSVAGFLYILDFGLSNVLVQLYVGTLTSKGVAEVGRLASTLFWALMGTGAVGAMVLSLLALLVPQWMKLPAQRSHTVLALVVLASATVALALPAMAPEDLCRAFHRFDRINQLQAAMVVFRVVLTVAVLSAGKGIVGLAIVQALLSLVRLILLWTVAQSSIGGLSLRLFRFDAFRLRPAMRMSGWAFGDDLSRRIAMNADTMIVAGLGGFRQVAMLGMGAKLPAHLYQFALRGLSVLMPSLSRHYSEGDTAQLRNAYGKAFRVCLTGVLPLVLFAAICSRQLMEVWAGPPYRGAAPVLVWLLVFALSQVLEIPSDLVLYSHGRIRQAARFSIIESAAKIATVLALVVPFGAAGAAAGVALTHWSVNLFGYLPEACRVARLRRSELWREALAGNRGLAAVCAAGAAILYTASRQFPATWVFVACAGVCVIHAAVWLASTVLPMRKGEARNAAAAAV
jgi:O-antigen/teichoic acid export membrane protein